MKNHSQFLLFVIFLTSLFSAPAYAQQDAEYLCYWRRSDGTLVNLSKVCNSPVITSTNLSPDAAFVADFQTLANRYPENIRQDLQNYIDQNRNGAIASAKATCRVLKFGGEAAELKRRQRLVASDSSVSAEARNQIIPTLAVNHYCPEFAKR